MAILKVRDPVTGEFKGVPAIKGDTGEKGEKGDKGDPGEATGDISEAVANFTESAERTNLTTGDTVKNQFSKIKKWFSDLKNIAFTGSYNDLTDTPTSLPADGGNADTIDDKHASDFMNRYNAGAISTFDTFIEAGVYRVQEISVDANRPIGMNQYGQLLVLSGENSDTITQIYCNYDNNKMFSRSCHSWGIDPSNWTKWDRINSLFDIDVINVTNADNAPSGISILQSGGSNNPCSFHCTLMTFVHNAEYIQQIAFPWGSNEYQSIKYRIKDNNVWFPWKNLNDNGNADTVDGHHAWQQQCLSDTGVAYSYWSFLQWDGAIGYFRLNVDGADGSHHKVHVANSDTVDNLHVDYGTHNTYGLRSISMDTFDLQAGVTSMSPGHIYIMYE